MFKKILIGIVVIFIIMQFFRIDQTNPEVIAEQDFLKLTNAPNEVATLVKNACYDCHSNETKYPWYANIAPASWLLANHRNEGREHVNFSIFSTYNKDQKNHILDECVEVLEKGEMPMKSYVVMHPEADLTAEQTKMLMNYFKTSEDSQEHQESETHK